MSSLVNKDLIGRSNSEAPPCRYGSNCYRQNPVHFKEYSHPAGFKMPLKRSLEDDTDQPGPSKSVKLDKNESTNLNSDVNFSTDFGFYVSTVEGVADKWNDASIARSLKGILNMESAQFVDSVQFNYMVDLNWLLSQYPAVNRTKPLLIVSGSAGNDWTGLQEIASEKGNVSLAQARVDIPYGTHHTKMMLLRYESGIRVVIHTGNLISHDWQQKTQGIFLTPILPFAGDGAPDSVTNFRSDLISYLKAYRLKSLEAWIQRLKQVDASDVKVHIVGSVPGRHTGSSKNAWGHLRLRKVLHDELKEVASDSYFVAQFSSVGSLGPQPESWLTGEFLQSLKSQAQPQLQSFTSPKFPLRLVYPSVDNVRLSLEGYPAGASLPYSFQTAMKQPYFRRFLHQWKSDRCGRSPASPHIKTYLRTNSDFTSVSWFLCTSANLSKAAWGALEKQQTQLMIRSYELGVLFLPSNYGFETFSTEPGKLESFPLPIDLPPVPYQKNDVPWIFDVPCLEKPDSHGKAWAPQSS